VATADPLADVGKPLILDFGPALRDNNEMTTTVDGHVLGTPACVSAASMFLCPLSVYNIER